MNVLAIDIQTSLLQGVLRSFLFFTLRLNNFFGCSSGLVFLIGSRVFFLLLFVAILPLVNLLKNSVFVKFSQFSVKISDFSGVCHDDFVKDEFLDDILVDGVLFELEIVVVNCLSFNNLVIMVWIV